MARRTKPKKQPLMLGRTETWLSAQTRARMEAGKQLPDDDVMIEFKTALALPNGREVIVSGSIIGHSDDANVVANAMHASFTEENHALAVAREHHIREKRDMQSQADELQRQVFALTKLLEQQGERAGGQPG